MQTDQAVQIINDLIFRPGWTFYATPRYGYPGQITVTIMMDTVDSDREYAPEYRQRRLVGDYYHINVSRLDEHGLLYELLENIAKTHQHEDREFLRRASHGYDAPFHPHRPEGEFRWQRAQAVSARRSPSDVPKSYR